MLPGASPSLTPVKADWGRPDPGAWLAQSGARVGEQAPREAPEKRQNLYLTNIAQLLPRGKLLVIMLLLRAGGRSRFRTT